jgi:hypothetical protein
VDLTRAQWRTSSFSGDGQNDNSCVEVAFLPAGRVAVRDTKDRARVPHLHPTAQWRAFVDGVRAGAFGR